MKLALAIALGGVLGLAAERAWAWCSEVNRAIDEGLRSVRG